MNIDNNEELLAMYNNVPDVVLFGVLVRCCQQIQERKYLSADDAIAFYSILSRVTDNAIAANDAVNKANAILRGDL